MRDTELLLEGVPPECITVGFLDEVMDVADRYGYPIEAISIL